MVKKAHIVVGLAYGDEGKGSIVDYLTRETGARFNVRFNGGCQAAHHVVLPNGTHHCFAQFGAGTFAGVTTILSKYVLVSPEGLEREATVLEGKGIKDPFSLIAIDENAPVVTYVNRYINKMQETARGEDRHGSCAWGIGLTQLDSETLGDMVLRMGDIKDFELTLKKLKFLKNKKMPEAIRLAKECPGNAERFEEFRELSPVVMARTLHRLSKRIATFPTESLLEVIKHEENIIFEGAQGVLLDQNHGFFPYVTRSNTTFVNAEQILKDSDFDGEIVKVGLLRAYSTRHGAGPLVTEEPGYDNIPACHNKGNEWQGNFRHGWFDCVTARYALEICDGVDILGLTNIDRMCNLDGIGLTFAYNVPDSRWDMRYLAPPEPENLEDRTDYSDYLRKCTPISLSHMLPWEDWNDPDDVHLNFYLGKIEVYLKTPIKLLSFGPTWKRKVLR